jgi:hypothetical protein
MGFCSNALGKLPFGYEKIRTEIEEQLAAHAEILSKEREKVVSAVAANGRLLQELAAKRIILERPGLSTRVAALASFFRLMGAAVSSQRTGVCRF